MDAGRGLAADLAEGMALHFPTGGLATAIAVFGITGVGATELVMYPYWCIEKGYARYTGPRDGSAAWLPRARGWIRVMHLDIACSLVIYTFATLAFYLLGAGVLHKAGLVPKASDMIVTLSRLYTETLGGWALWLFYAGAVITLYGTIFASTAAHARVTADLVRMAGGFARADGAARGRWRDINTVILATLPAIFFWTFGIAGADGGGGRPRPGADAAADRPGGRLPAAPARARRICSRRRSRPRPCGSPRS